ncbi:MAG: phosphomannomutase/phosphoglucomutase [Patescibacteria group bacterium]
MEQSIFKSYDIRGIYPKELDKKIAFKIGQAFIEITGAKKVAVARDARLSGEELLKALTDGIMASGADVFDVGQVPTECLYFAVGGYDFDAGIMITASHNPKKYNGFKMLKKQGKDISIIRGKDLLSFLESFSKDKKVFSKKGGLVKKDILQDFITHISSFSDSALIKPFLVIVDASNGVAGSVVAKIGEQIPAKVLLLNHKPDGHFPNHSPNPLAEGSIDQIKSEITTRKADFGFIFDGDADRIFLIDEKGEMVRADITLLLLAKYFLQKYPNSTIAYNAICSKSVSEFIEKWGGKPIKTQVGFVNVRDGLLKNNGSMGGELSGHYCFKDNFYLDSGTIAFLVLLQVISEGNKKVSELAAELSPYAKSSEINFEVKNKDEILNKIKEKYSDGKQDFLDGVTVEYADWWFNVRASNTEPLLRLTIEAESPVLLDIKQKELTEFILS